MSILIVQLSDLHFKWPADGLAARAKAVQQAVSAKIANPDVCFLVFSGDIANTGDPREYAIALDFINDLKRSLLAEGCRRVETIAVPGNHDLNLRQEIDTRQFLLESPEQYLKKPIALSIHTAFITRQPSISRIMPLLFDGSYSQLLTTFTGT